MTTMPMSTMVPTTPGLVSHPSEETFRTVCACDTAGSSAKANAASAYAARRIPMDIRVILSFIGVREEHGGVWFMVLDAFQVGQTHVEACGQFVERRDFEHVA